MVRETGQHRKGERVLDRNCEARPGDSEWLQISTGVFMGISYTGQKAFL